MPTTRRERITQLLNDHTTISLADLSEEFPDVSAMTLRRDLIHLEEVGVAIRVKGGAILANQAESHSGEESAYGIRANTHKDAKLTIAKKALALMETDRSIFFDAGSTIMTLSQQLQDDYYSIVTTGINVAQNLLEKERINVVVLGGYANRNTLSLSGPLSTGVLDAVNIDVAFISASGFTLDNHFTVSNIYEAELKRQIIAKATKVIVLMDTSKIGKSLPYTFAQAASVDIFITEAGLSKEIKSFFTKEKTQVL